MYTVSDFLLISISYFYYCRIIVAGEAMVIPSSSSHNLQIEK